MNFDQKDFKSTFLIIILWSNFALDHHDGLPHRKPEPSFNISGTKLFT